MEGKLAVRLFLEYIKRISQHANQVVNVIIQLELHKRRLADAVRQVEDYIECFRDIDLDKRGKITPKVLQNYLMFLSRYSEGRNTTISQQPSADSTASTRTTRIISPMKTCSKLFSQGQITSSYLTLSPTLQSTPTDPKNSLILATGKEWNPFITSRPSSFHRSLKCLTRITR
jgi:hypothetical protein